MTVTAAQKKKKDNIVNIIFMKKRIFLFAIILAVMGSVFAESKLFNFGEVTDEDIMVTLNSSQSTLDKAIKSTGSSIQVYTKVPFDSHANTMSITFIEPLIIENISNFKSAKLVGKSLGYDASVILHFVNSKGKMYKITFKDAITKIPGEYTLEWDNGSYIDDVRDRKPTIKPIWPFNDSDMYLYEVEYHMNECPKGYPYNAQELVSLECVYDKDTLDGGELKQSFEDNFKVEEKIKSENNRRTEKLRAEKKAAEDREKALMATEE